MVYTVSERTAVASRQNFICVDDELLDPLILRHLELGEVTQMAQNVPIPCSQDKRVGNRC